MIVPLVPPCAPRARLRDASASSGILARLCQHVVSLRPRHRAALSAFHKFRPSQCRNAIRRRKGLPAACTEIDRGRPDGAWR